MHSRREIEKSAQTDILFGLYTVRNIIPAVFGFGKCPPIIGKEILCKMRLNAVKIYLAL